MNDYQKKVFFCVLDWLRETDQNTGFELDWSKAKNADIRRWVAKALQEKGVTTSKGNDFTEDRLRKFFWDLSFDDDGQKINTRSGITDWLIENDLTDEFDIFDDDDDEKRLGYRSVDYGTTRYGMRGADDYRTFREDWLDQNTRKLVDAWVDDFLSEHGVNKNGDDG